MSVTPDEGRTHWHGCEREHGHHACALAELTRLRAEADAERICVLELRAQLDRANATAIQRKDELTRLRAELSDTKAALTEARGETYPKPTTGWQCFHCGEWFRSISSAESHFGTTPECMPKLRTELTTVTTERDELRTELEAMTRRAELAEGYAQPYHDEAARLRAELERARGATAETIIRDCIPGGSVCDPQQVADAIRAWTQEPPA